MESKIPKSKESFSSYLQECNNKSIFLTPYTHTEIMSIKKDMKYSKACGPYNIPTNLLIEFSDQLADPLASIINMSLKDGVFPSFSKEADVCPIHKNCEKTKCENYRPISLPNISKAATG